VLKKEQHEVKFVDGSAQNLNESDVVNLLSRFDPDYTVIYATTPSIRNDVFYARLSHQLGSKTILIGPHVSAAANEVLSWGLEAINHVVVGEYDYAVRDIINGRSSDKIVKYPLIQSLDELPFPDWSQIDPLWYYDSVKLYPFLTVLAGRGCDWGMCNFCALPAVMYGRPARYRSSSKVVDEMEYDYSLHPQIKEIFFEDDTLTSNRERCRQICREILNRRLDVTWSANSRADLLDFELLTLMRKAGCRLLCVGYESGSNNILRNVKKGLSIGTAERFTKLCKEVGIKIHGCFMIGLPIESRKTAVETIRYALRLGCDSIQIHGAVPCVGTEFYDYCKRNGFLVTDEWSQWLDEEGEQIALVDYSNAGGIDNSEINAYVDYGLRAYYGRPRYWLRSLLNMRSVDDVYRLFRGAWSIFRSTKKSKGM